MESGNPKSSASSAELNALKLTSTPINVYNKQNVEHERGIHISSPLKDKADQLKLLITNFQRIRSKKEEIELMLLDNNIDVVVKAANISKELKILLRKYKTNPIWFGGDMNLPDIDWSTNSITKHQYVKDINECFLDTFSKCNLERIE